MPCTVHPEVITGLTACARCGKEYCGDCIIPLRGEMICGACKQDAVQDIRSGATTGLDLAGRGARLGAILVDGLIFTPFVVGIMYAQGRFDFTHPHALTGVDILTQYVLFPLASAAYEGIMLGAFGQTLGKMALGIRVVRSDGSRITPGLAWRRGILRNILQVSQIGGFIDALMIFSRPRTTLHDRWATTAVVVGRR